MSELSLHGEDVAGLFYEMTPHRVPRQVRRHPFHVGDPRQVIPNLIDDVDGQPPGALRYSRGRQEKHRLIPDGGIRFALVLYVVADRRQTFGADLVAVY